MIDYGGYRDLPSPRMREAMYRAELGDDVFGRTTVKRMAAERLGGRPVVAGRWATGFCSTTAVAATDHRGDRAHLLFKRGARPRHPRAHHSNTADGAGPADVQEAAPTATYFPRSRLLCLENSTIAAEACAEPARCAR